MKNLEFRTRELFTDTEFLAKIDSQVQRRLHHPERKEVVLSPGFPYGTNLTGQGTILPLPDAKWRMYFRGGCTWKTMFCQEEKGEPACFAAESTDGKKWEIVTPQSILHKKTFFPPVTLKPLNATFFYDSNPDAPADEKFKMLCYGYLGEIAGERDGLFLAVSPDGFNFKLKYDKPFDIETQFDTQNILFWDPRLKKYHLYTRIRRFGKRGIRMHLTEDFKTFTNASDITFRNNMFPDTQLYTNCIQPYFRAEKYYLGFPCRYCDHDQKWDNSVLYMPGAERKAYWINDRKYTRLGTVATDSLFMSSRNGWIFDRYDESFLRPGPCTDGNWLYGDNYLFYGIIPTCSDLGCGAPDEISMYAIENYMGDKGENVRFRRLSIRQDGFVSLNFPAQGGEIITKAFEFEGESLSLNLATSAWGNISVAILDEDNNPIDGFREKDMFPIYGDGLDIRPMWRGKGSDLRELKGKKIALRFRGKDADLYSYAQTTFRPDPQLPPITPEAVREADI